MSSSTRAMLAAAALAACWAGASYRPGVQAGRQGDPRSLDQFEFYGMTASGPAVEMMRAEWQEEHPCVVLSRSVFGGGFPIRNAVELALTSGEAPDVFYTWPSGAGLTVLRQGRLPDRSDALCGKVRVEGTSSQWAIERNTYQGKLYAYPWEQDLEYVYYNKQPFSKEIGIEVPQSFDDVLAWCDAASAPV